MDSARPPAPSRPSKARLFWTASRDPVTLCQEKAGGGFSLLPRLYWKPTVKFAWLEVPESSSHPGGQEEGKGQDPLLEEKATPEATETGGKEPEEEN